MIEQRSNKSPDGYGNADFQLRFVVSFNGHRWTQSCVWFFWLFYLFIVGDSTDRSVDVDRGSTATEKAMTLISHEIREYYDHGCRSRAIRAVPLG
ncbi:MAG: hypothetical protein J6386_25755 [Candidatus Synoicihabitans palmerolidicus]|nr:hypothetical protein [Candidatus Synoicihabitans palmerolidicus]MCC5025904.1 hypothetical protein [Candidatus Synoicihabitans palmerolidicus]MCC5025984.1 hypothetical protein [Candidatus Synoicihabitans palmerolidicus]